MKVRTSYFWSEAQFNVDNNTISWDVTEPKNAGYHIGVLIKNKQINQYPLDEIISLRRRGYSIQIVPNPKYFDPDTLRSKRSAPLKRDQLNDDQKQIFDAAMEKFKTEFASAQKSFRNYRPNEEVNPTDSIQGTSRNHVNDEEFQRYFGEPISESEHSLEVMLETSKLQEMIAKPTENEPPIANWMSSSQSSKRAHTTSSEQIDREQFWREVEFKPPGIITWQSSKFNKDATRYIREFLNENEELGNQFQLELIGSNPSETAHIKLQPSQSFLNKNSGTQTSIHQFGVFFALNKMRLFEESSDLTSAKRQKLT